MTFWNDENTAEATRLYLLGDSAALICKKIGAVSRNAVIGRLSRKGVLRVAEEKPPCKKIDAAGNRRPTALETSAEIIAEKGPPGGLTVAEMPRFGRCRWPIGGSGFEMKMCGARCEGTYCQSKTCGSRFAYAPASPSRQKSRLRGDLFAAER